MPLRGSTFLLFSLIALFLAGCEGIMPAPPAMVMNEKVFTAPVEMGFPALDTASENFHSKVSWNKFGEVLKEAAKTTNVASLGDWQTLHDLNQQASNLWNELLACNNNNPEKTRANYYSGQVCTNSQNEALKKKLITLHQDFDNFLRSTQFYLPSSTKRNIPWETKTLQGQMFGQILYDFAAKISNLPTDYDYSDPQVIAWQKLRATKQPLFHPLFTQIALEYMALLNRIAMSPYESPYHFNVSHQDTQNNKVVLDYRFSNTFFLKMTELTYWKELSDLKLLDTVPAYETARAFTNSWMLYSSIAKESCEQIGLWPELSYAALVVITGQIDLKLPREVARSVNDANCKGKIPKLEEKWKAAPFIVNDRDLISAQRKVAAQYGFTPLTRVQCISAPAMNRIRYGDGESCFTLDPSAPGDAEAGKDWRRENFNNPQAVRMKLSYDYISNH